VKRQPFATIHGLRVGDASPARAVMPAPAARCATPDPLRWRPQICFDAAASRVARFPGPRQEHARQQRESHRSVTARRPLLDLRAIGDAEAERRCVPTWPGSRMMMLTLDPHQRAAALRSSTLGDRSRWRSRRARALLLDDVGSSRSIPPDRCRT